jgi:hypothetical protein
MQSIIEMEQQPILLSWHQEGVVADGNTKQQSGAASCGRTCRSSSSFDSRRAHNTNTLLHKKNGNKMDVDSIFQARNLLEICRASYHYRTRTSPSRRRRRRHSIPEYRMMLTPEEKSLVSEHESSLERTAMLANTRRWRSEPLCSEVPSRLSSSSMHNEKISRGGTSGAGPRRSTIPKKSPLARFKRQWTRSQLRESKLLGEEQGVMLGVPVVTTMPSSTSSKQEGEENDQNATQTTNEVRNGRKLVDVALLLSRQLSQAVLDGGAYHHRTASLSEGFSEASLAKLA